jgi:glycosyltransferase involved in cell wall biosynthesis
MNVILVRSRASDPNVLKIARVLAKNDIQTSLLIWDRTGNNQDTILNKISIHYFRMRAPYDKATVVFYLPFWWLYEFYFLLRYINRDTVIHACDLDTLWPAIFVKILKRIRLNYTIYDFYADNLPNKTPRIFRNFIAFIEKKGLQFAYTVFLVDESRLAQIKGAKCNNIVYIYNTPEDVHRDKYSEPRPDRKEMIIFYAGVLHQSRGLLQIIQAIEPLENVKLIIAGEGPEQHLFEKQDPVINKQIQYIGWIRYDEVIKHTFNSDCIIALYDPTIPNNRYASPNKLFEAMMCGKPIIVNDETSMADIVRREECGIVVPFGDVNAIKHAIITLKDDPELCKQLGANGRKAYDKKYSWEKMEKNLHESYNSLINLEK